MQSRINQPWKNSKSIKSLRTVAEVDRQTNYQIGIGYMKFLRLGIDLIPSLFLPAMRQLSPGCSVLLSCERREMRLTARTLPQTDWDDKQHAGVMAGYKKQKPEPETERSTLPQYGHLDLQFPSTLTIHIAVRLKKTGWHGLPKMRNHLEHAVLMA